MPLWGPSGLASRPLWLAQPLARLWLGIPALPAQLGTGAACFWGQGASGMLASACLGCSCPGGLCMSWSSPTRWRWPGQQEGCAAHPMPALGPFRGPGGTEPHCVPHSAGAHRGPSWRRGSSGPWQRRIPCSDGERWIPPGLSGSPSTLDHPHPPRHRVPPGDLRPDWLLCVITGTVKGRAVIGCLRMILEAGLQLAVGGSPPTKAEL